MQVVVTGASGFMGRFVTKSLINAGINTVCVSRQDIPGFVRVAKYRDAPPGEVLIHLAEFNNRSLANQLSTKYEYEALCNFYALLRKNYKKFIYASSALVYGDSVCTPRLESEVIVATDSYTRVKVAAEQSALSCGGVVVRLGNVFGPGMPSENVLSHILGQLDQDGPLTLHDTGPVRDFVWVEDAAEAFTRIVTQHARGVFNVGTGIGTSIGELAKITLEKANQAERQIVSTRLPVKRSCIILDTTKVNLELEWQPSTSLSEGLERLVGYQPALGQPRIHG